ncbi:MAG: transcriptional regulator [Promethearchaeota archaeon]
MRDLDTWETRRQKLINFLEIQKLTLDLREIMREMDYSSKKELLNDIISVSKTLRNKGKSLIIEPPSCIVCGFEFQIKRTNLKIPSKCPKCKQQRINWPSIKVKDI